MVDMGLGVGAQELLLGGPGRLFAQEVEEILVLQDVKDRSQTIRALGVIFAGIVPDTGRMGEQQCWHGPASFPKRRAG